VKATDDKPGKHVPVGMNRRGAIRRRILKQYHLHPIRDRELIRRWLPKLYAGYCRRRGWTYPYVWVGGWTPAMEFTGCGLPPGHKKPDNSPAFWAALPHGTSRKWAGPSCIARRLRERREIPVCDGRTLHLSKIPCTAGSTLPIEIDPNNSSKFPADTGISTRHLVHAMA
jgi:hypothetical protein